MSLCQRRSLRLSRSTINGEENLYPYVPPTSFFIEEDDEEETAGKLSDLIKITWKLYTVSPLYNLSRDEPCLKHYQNYISEELLKLKIKDLHFKVTLESVPELAPTENDEGAFRLQILSKKKRKVSTFYEGIFLSWRSSGKQTSSNQASINLPLLLCSGSVPNIRKVHIILARCFDCVFEKFQLAQYDLKWLTCLAVKYSPSKTNHLDLIYFMHRSSCKTATVTARSDFEALRTIWDCISQEDRITYEDVNKFIAGVHEHFLNTYQIDFNKLSCKSIAASGSVVINNQGKVRVHSVKVMDCLLKYFSTTYHSRRLLR
ncbi:unnamed protein product [Bemisia tabaci]|uniref:Centromere protein L n=1 Tax=Bemisia tabaci TaxID=7038 RepID=A0A9P0AHF5_BEMTA|nr:unnamed protein product [Bemisia tabaci]